MYMTYIRIEVKDEDYIVVIADSKRFGRNEVMFEGNTFKQCFDYIKRETGKDKLHLTGQMVPAYVDRTGRIYPCYMEVR